ncbi:MULTISPECIES: DUF1804 family protein [unclassified Polaromonas]|jgi:uncharacterized protein YjcR|uniref:DUF1804 family protein n=1 Tax=unclassified Polaromonas TaxID=2638319 RepID=UPI000BD951D3|nr:MULTISPECIES: DUF1804 family protein [unclassified Polaromonas]OYZ76057.1 MAG: hypothetical protein B7Y09_21765 [Polaromonas sp. 24-63-21]OZA47344.1 MAG: hypothetical protein B7X88_22230 [Polaromonas sp. 17-63-33]
MAYDQTTRGKVRTKYLQGMSLDAAAQLCKVPYNTARNWKRQAKVGGDDWDLAKNARRMSKGGMEEMANDVLGGLAEQFLATIEAIKADPKMDATKRADILVKLMDGFNKAIGAASRAMPNGNRLAVAMDVLKFMTVFIGKKAPKFQKQFLELAEAAGPEFVAEFGSGN